ncbi:MAG: hypothetical protein GY719_32990 [bacterium]|nr:hypothetical protein [bacterium]
MPEAPTDGRGTATDVPRDDFGNPLTETVTMMTVGFAGQEREVSCPDTRRGARSAAASGSPACRRR